MLINKGILKFIYSALLTGMPSLTYNPINKNILHAAFDVNQYSTYLNFRLNDNEINTITKFIEKNNDDFEIAKVELLQNRDDKDYFLSVNIYNCSSPIFSFIDENYVTRCEINVYVYNKNDEKSTLILDYTSNQLSLDPENLFKPGKEIIFKKQDNIITGLASNKNFKLKFNYDYQSRLVNTKLSKDIIKSTDKIYYNNGIYDKVYYDSTLIDNEIVCCEDFNIEFHFLGLAFSHIDSVFYFKNKINFVGGLWFNLYDQI
jgi:hypothetical protein